MKPSISMILPLILLAMAEGSPTRAQTRLFHFEADSVDQAFGYTLNAAGDVDRDGFTDLLIGSVNYGKPSRGVLFLHSGRDGRRLRTWHRPFTTAMFSPVPVGDWNRDGYDDFAGVVNADDYRGVKVLSGKDLRALFLLPLPNYYVQYSSVLMPLADLDGDGRPELIKGGGTRAVTYGWFDTTTILAISSKTGKVLYDVKKVQKMPYTVDLGNSLARVRDVDGDRVPDFLAGDRYYASSSWGRGPGRAWLFSGKTGKILHVFPAPAGVSGFGVDVAALDLDGDGKDEYLIYMANSSGGTGRVLMYSGKTYALFRTHLGKQSWESFGAPIQVLSDWNGDGVKEYAISAAGNDENGKNAGAVYVFSGKDGKQLLKIKGRSAYAWYGARLADLGDLDGDGRDELAVATGFYNPPQPKPAKDYVDVWSYGPKSLWSDTHKVSLSGLGRQNLSLDAGTQQAGRFYLLLGSFAGIKPGLKLGSLTLPLNLDPYMRLTALFPNAPFLPGSLGRLDAQGRAKAAFQVLAGMPPSLVGRRADHAYLVFDLKGPSFASNWVPLLFER